MALNFPANPVDGQSYGSYVYSSSSGAWKSREESATVAVTSPVAPSSAKSGDIWINTNTGSSYFYYGDGDSNQWVEILSSSVSSLNQKANIESPTFTGTVILPSTTSIGTVSSLEISYIDGVTSSIQTQINSKADLSGAVFTGAISAASSIIGTTPVNGGSAGGLVVKTPPSGTQTSAYLQFTNNASTVQYGSIAASTTNIITVDGKLTVPNQPTFFAYQPESGTYMLGSGTPVFTTTILNTGSGYNTSNGRFTAPVAGVYEFKAMMLVRTASGAGEMTLLKNGANVVSRNLAYSYPVGASAHDPVHISIYLSLAAGDYIQISVSQPSGGDWYFGGGLGWFGGRLVG